MNVSLRSFLILTLILLPGILNLNAVYATTKTPTFLVTIIVTPLPITAGGSVKDSAGLSGTHASTASGTVTYSLYTGSSCSNKASQTNIVPVTSGTVPDSAPFVINTAGTYSLRAAYSGDASNRASTSTCETPVTVNKATPTLTESFTSPIPAGGSVIVTGTLTSASATAHGTVIYQLFVVLVPERCLIQVRNK
jgi:hypothetical protein